MFNSKSSPTARSNLNRQKGMGLVEMGFALAVAAIITIGVVSYFSSNSTAAQAAQLGNDLSMLTGKVKSAYGGQYANVTNARLSSGGFFSKLPALTNNGGVVTTSLGGGTLTVAPGTVTTANDSVRYTITQLPDDACLPLVTALAKTATTLNIGANVVKAAGALPDPSRITCENDNTTLVFQVM